MKTSPTKQPGPLSGDTPPVTTSTGRHKSALPTNRRASLIVVEGVEDKVRPGPWKSHLALSLLGAAILWFLIQSVLLQLADIIYVPITSAQATQGLLISVPDASPPFSSLLNKIQAIATMEPGADPLTFPLTWVAILAMFYGLMTMADRRRSGFSSRVLDEVPYGLKVEQEKFFTGPPREGGSISEDATSAGGKEDLDGDFFADDLPAHIRKSLYWWNQPSAPDTAILANSLSELKSYLGDEAYYWFCACSVWPEPLWHLVLFLGRGLRNARGESLHSFESADRLASLPWFMSGKMPLWLRRYLLGNLGKEQQQQIRYIIQALLVSTARGAKSDFALELADYHTLFMKTAGNELSQSVLKTLPANSTLRDELFTQFMSKPLDAQFYRGLKERDSSGTAVPTGERAGADLARISRASRWISRLIWGACAAVTVGSAGMLIALNTHGGVRLTTRHNQGTVEIVGRERGKKNPPATFFWLPTGVNEVRIISKDYETVTLKVDVKGRVIADLGSVVMKHGRTGFSHPQAGDAVDAAP